MLTQWEKVSQKDSTKSKNVLLLIVLHIINIIASSFTYNKYYNIINIIARSFI